MDAVADIQAQIHAARADRVALAPIGSNGKHFYGRAVEARPLDLRPLRGIVHYDPTELVVTVRAGTPLAELEAALAAEGQYLPCEPPAFGDEPTVGGTIAAGLSGPRRPWSGALRDFVLGSRIIDSDGRLLRFGGEVMKNVAGYDLSRALVGSLGCLAVIAEVSLKVLPRPRHTRSLKLGIDLAESLRRLQGWAREPLPISGASHDGSGLMLRLEGGHGSVEAAVTHIGGHDADPAYWSALRDHQLPFFGDLRKALWRLALPPSIGPLALPGDALIDWGGQQRWLVSQAAGDEIRALATRHGGHACLFRGVGGSPVNAPFHPLPPALMTLHRRLKAQLDPHGLFNPGRMYAEF